jgi:squalene-hopene/tetraprenyl-beta-curcumene cyclase
MTAGFEIPGDLFSQAAATLDRAARRLLEFQKPDGEWCADLTADTTLESDYILLQLWLYPPVEGRWDPPSRALVDKAARSILGRQLEDGGFNIYVDGPSEISATVKAYFALKLAGYGIGDIRMAKARERILALGGIQAANSYVKVNLSLFGLYPRDSCPSIPPEVVLLPFDFLYQMSSWTRAIVAALSIVHAANPMRPVPAGFHIDELFLPGVRTSLRRSPKLFTWRNCFLAADRFLKFWERHGSRSIRARAVREAERWMVERTKDSDGLGAIYPPMMYAIMAFDALGYPPDHPERAEALRQFDRLMVDDGRPFFFQPCFSPVWDTAMAGYALGEAGGAAGPLRRAADWLLAREIRRKGDWAVKRPSTEPSGWCFEYANAFYPDIDDTAMVLLAMNHARASNPEAQRACHKRALDWLLAMQSKNGGWAAFDADNDWSVLAEAPFADHNAMLDPPCADITGRILEALGAHGLGREHPAVRRGAEYLVRTQEADGSWYGRWGVAYVYGTCFALRGLAAAGESDREAHVLRAGEWLRSIQNPDGGWGESCASYDNDCFTAGPSTPSQTAWAIMGLIAGGDTASLSIRNGIRYLIETQRGDGDWDERLSTGTGFPRVFYLNYHLYRLYFPVMALAAVLKAGARR